MAASSTPAPCWHRPCRARTWAWSAKPACRPWPTRAHRWCAPRTTWALEVVPLVGPVSLLLALAASGLNGQNFAFVGYLPQDPASAPRIRELESLALKTRADPAVHRNALPQCGLLASAAADPATRHAPGGQQRPDAGHGAHLSDRAKARRRRPCRQHTPAVFAIGAEAGAVRSADGGQRAQCAHRTSPMAAPNAWPAARPHCRAGCSPPCLRP
jgi:hypothetical protein